MIQKVQSKNNFMFKLVPFVSKILKKYLFLFFSIFISLAKQQEKNLKYKNMWN